MQSLPHQAYRQAAVETAPAAQLVLLLYRGAIRFARAGAGALDKGELETANVHLLRAQEIVAELRATLDMGAGEIAESLDSLYDYFLRRLRESNLRKEAAPALEVAGMLEELLPAWEAAASGAPAPTAGGRSQRSASSNAA